MARHARRAHRAHPSRHLPNVRSRPAVAAGRSNPSPTRKPRKPSPKGNSSAASATKKTSSSSSAKVRKARRGEGSLYQRKQDGLWVVASSVGLNRATGRRSRAVRAFANKALAQNYYNATRAKILMGTPVTPPSALKLSDYLDQWLQDTHAALPNGTWNARESKVRRHINPVQALGRFTLGQLDFTKLDTWLNTTLVNGWPDPKNPKTTIGAIDYLTRRQARAVLHKALEDAKDRGHITVNPVTRSLKTIGKRQQLRQARPMTVPEATAFLKAVSKLPAEWRAPFWILAVVGLRAGELIGLREEHFIPAKGAQPPVLKVEAQIQRRRSPRDKGAPANGDDTQLFVPLKTSGSLRQLVIPTSVAKHITTRLKANAKIRALRSSKPWNPDRLLFCQPDGTNWVYEDMWREFRLLCTAAKLPFSDSTNPTGFNPHDLRATAVCTAALQGADLATLMTMLGHSSPRMTLEYLRSLPGMQAQLATRLNKIFAKIP